MYEELKRKTPYRDVLFPRRYLDFWCAVDCAGGGPGAMTSPAGIPNFLVEGSSIAQSAVGVKTLRQAAPWLSRAGLQACGKITTTNRPVPGYWL